MTLIWNWRAVLKRAWSVRLIVLAGLLSGAEVAVAFINPDAIAPGRLAMLSGLVSCAALVARLLAQQKLED